MAEISTFLGLKLFVAACFGVEMVLTGLTRQNFPGAGDFHALRKRFIGFHATHISLASVL